MIEFQDGESTLAWFGRPIAPHALREHFQKIIPDVKLIYAMDLADESEYGRFPELIWEKGLVYPDEDGA